MGLILSLLALGIYISYRVFDIADITVDGSITLGAAICAVLIVAVITRRWPRSAGLPGAWSPAPSPASCKPSSRSMHCSRASW